MTLNDLKQAINESQWDLVSQLIFRDSSLVKRHYFMPTFLGGYQESADVLPLHHVCSRSDAPLQIIQTMVSMYPKSVHKTETSLRRTCLHIALLRRLTDDVTSFLVDAYPDATQKQDRLGRVPLHYAFSNLSSSAIVKKLIHISPQSVLAPDKKSWWTPLHIAVTTDVDPDVISLMVETLPESALMVLKTGSTVQELAEKSQCKNRNEIVAIISRKKTELDKLPEYQNFEHCFSRLSRRPSSSSSSTCTSSTISSYRPDKEKQELLLRRSFV